jgi:uncharacterized membrane protein (DUF485 family)
MEAIVTDAAQDVRASEYQRVQQSPEFQDLRRRFRNFVFPMTALFLIWYLLYVLLATYAKGFMSTNAIGELNWAFVFAFLQFVSTFVITMVYARWANKRFDPPADALRRELEGTTEGAQH